MSATLFPQKRQPKGLGLTHVIGCLVIALLNSCSAVERYEVTLNERTLYVPQSLFDGYQLSDPALSTCVNQAIEDFAIYSADGLEILNCSEAGISSLTGLAIFTDLKRLKLSNNTIRNLVELSSLQKLVEVRLNNNNIVDSVPLSGLPALTLVDLSGNPDLQCPGLIRFMPRTDVQPPAHCQ